MKNSTKKNFNFIFHKQPIFQCILIKFFLFKNFFHNHANLYLLKRINLKSILYSNFFFHTYLEIIKKFEDMEILKFKEA
jgi:hypothetical protein